MKQYIFQWEKNMQKLILIWHLHRLFLNTHIEYLKAVKVEIDICFDLKLTSIDSCFIFHSFVAIGIITQYNMKNIGRNPHAINRDSRWQVTTIFRLSLTRRLILQSEKRFVLLEIAIQSYGILTKSPDLYHQFWKKKYAGWL